MYQNSKRYNITASHGESKVLQGDGSEVSMTLPEGSQGVYMTRVHTDQSQFHGVIPDNECIISPLVEVENIPFQEIDDKEVAEKIMYLIDIPHSLSDEDMWHQELWKFIKVRHGNMYKSGLFREIPTRNERQDSGAYYEIKSRFITVYTDHFSEFICTICKNVCTASVTVFLIGKLVPLGENEKTMVEIKPYLCSSLYKIEDYREVLLSFNLLKN